MNTLTSSFYILPRFVAFHRAGGSSTAVKNTRMMSISIIKSKKHSRKDKRYKKCILKAIISEVENSEAKYRKFDETYHNWRVRFSGLMT